MKSPWKTKSSKVVYKNPWYRVRQDKVVRPDGKPGEYNVVETQADACFIVPLSEKNEFYLINQFRYPINEFSWEVPNGSSEGENLLKAAKRELWEETGFTAGKVEKIGWFYSMNGISSEKCVVFAAFNIKISGKDMKEEEGIFEVKKFPVKKILEMIEKGQIRDGQTIAAIIQTLLYLGDIGFRT